MPHGLKGRKQSPEHVAKRAAVVSRALRGRKLPPEVIAKRTATTRQNQLLGLSSNRARGVPCDVEGCSKLSWCSGLCAVHYSRWYRHGDPLAPVGPAKMTPGQKREAAISWKGDDLSYSGAHMRLRRERGSVAGHQCAMCDKPARHWAFNHNTPEERTRYGVRPPYPEPIPYSPDPEWYLPLCVPCHKRYDLGSIP